MCGWWLCGIQKSKCVVGKDKIKPIQIYNNTEQDTFTREDMEQTLQIFNKIPVHPPKQILQF
jgi:hypothetical protein